MSFTPSIGSGNHPSSSRAGPLSPYGVAPPASGSGGESATRTAGNPSQPPGGAPPTVIHSSALSATAASLSLTGGARGPVGQLGRRHLPDRRGAGITMDRQGFPGAASSLFDPVVRPEGLPGADLHPNDPYRQDVANRIVAFGDPVTGVPAASAVAAASLSLTGGARDPVDQLGRRHLPDRRGAGITMDRQGFPDAASPLFGPVVRPRDLPGADLHPNDPYRQDAASGIAAFGNSVTGGVSGGFQEFIEESLRRDREERDLLGPRRGGIAGRSPPAAAAISSSLPQSQLQLLVEEVRRGTPNPLLYDRLKEYFRGATLQEQGEFVRIFSRDDSPHFRDVRRALASTVYQPISPLGNERVKWLSKEEIDQAIGEGTRGDVNDVARRCCSSAFFYHATQARNLESILAIEQIVVARDRTFRGAFVSTKPEIKYGRCVLAFRPCIAWKSKPENSFCVSDFRDGSRYWVGFSEAIPVNKETLAYVMLEDKTQKFCDEFQEAHDLLVKWNVPVIPLEAAQPYLEITRKLNMGVPVTWPTTTIGRPRRAPIAAPPVTVPPVTAPPAAAAGGTSLFEQIVQGFRNFCLGWSSTPAPANPPQDSGGPPL